MGILKGRYKAIQNTLIPYRSLEGFINKGDIVFVIGLAGNLKESDVVIISDSLTSPGIDYFHRHFEKCNP